jgi:predicted acylesterase/phospholipase RssA
MIRHPGKSSISQLIGELGQAVPSGIFDNETIHNFLEQAFTVTGHSNRFEDLDAELYIVAVDLDTGAAVRFGSKAHGNVSIARAVQASAALPGLYPPVEIDGRFFVDGALRRTLHASVALDEGVDLLLCINPLVPFDATESPAHPRVQTQKLINGGLPLILSQTFRALIQSRMKAGFKSYQRSHTKADLILLEPDRGDGEIFFTNIFSYASRTALCEHAYQITRGDLLAHADQLGPLLAERGMSLRLDLLQDPERSLGRSISEGQSGHAMVSRDLARTLDELEHMLERNAAV